MHVFLHHRHHHWHRLHRRNVPAQTRQSSVPPPRARDQLMHAQTPRICARDQLIPCCSAAALHCQCRVGTTWVLLIIQPHNMESERDYKFIEKHSRGLTRLPACTCIFACLNQLSYICQIKMERKQQKKERAEGGTTYHQCNMCWPFISECTVCPS